jgi:hypothetical protein
MLISQGIKSNEPPLVSTTWGMRTALLGVVDLSSQSNGRFSSARITLKPNSNAQQDPQKTAKVNPSYFCNTEQEAVRILGDNASFKNLKSVGQQKMLTLSLKGFSC